MPFTPEQKRAYYKKKREEKETVLDELSQYEELDKSGDHVKGEFSTWVDLWKIFHGIDTKADPDKKPKEGIKFINPSAIEFQGRILEFQEWLDLRRLYRSDLWALMQLVGEGRWSEQAHKPLAEFFVKKDNTQLPLNYTRGDLSRILYSLDEQHFRLLLYPRGNRKSTVSLIDTIQWVVNFPDIVILICTSTKALGKKFVRVLRSYFTVADYNRPTDFQVIYPDFCIPEDKGKLSGDVREFWCPKRHLRGTVNPTLSYTSMEASTAGVRADVIKFDDAVDDQNYRKAEQRVAVREKFDAVRELLIGQNGFTDVVGTRYTDGLKVDTPEGAEPDLYGTILKRFEGDESLKKLIASAWTVLPEFEDVPIQQIERPMVTLLFPNLSCLCGVESEETAKKCKGCGEPLEKSPGSFESLKKKCKDNEISFRCQQLNQPAAELNDEEAYVNTFTEDNIRARQKRLSEIPDLGPQDQRVIFVDTAMTAGRKSDYSAFAVVQTQYRGDDLPPLIWYIDYMADRYTDQVVAETIAGLMKKWDCNAQVEQIPNCGILFKNEVLKQMYLRDIKHLECGWFTPDQQPKAKETRIRGLQILHDLGLLRFVHGPMYELMVKQLIGYAGHKPKGKTGRKDDLPDAMSYVYRILPYIAGYSTEEQKKEQEEREKNWAMRQQYDRIHNYSVPSREFTPEVEETAILFTTLFEQ